MDKGTRRVQPGHGNEHTVGHKQSRAKNAPHQDTKYVHKDTEQPDMESHLAEAMGAAGNAHAYGSTVTQILVLALIFLMPRNNHPGR